MKKFLVAVSVGVFLFTGCGNNQSSDNKVTSSQQVEKSESAIVEKNLNGTLTI